MGVVHVGGVLEEDEGGHGWWKALTDSMRHEGKRVMEVKLQRVKMKINGIISPNNRSEAAVPVTHERELLVDKDKLSGRKQRTLETGADGRKRCRS